MFVKTLSRLCELLHQDFGEVGP